MVVCRAQAHAPGVAALAPNEDAQSQSADGWEQESTAIPSRDRPMIAANEPGPRLVGRDPGPVVELRPTTVGSVS